MTDLKTALGEAVAHVHALAMDGRLKAAQAADGVWRYATA